MDRRHALFFTRHYFWFLCINFSQIYESINQSRTKFWYLNHAFIHLYLSSNRTSRETTKQHIRLIQSRNVRSLASVQMSDKPNVCMVFSWATYYFQSSCFGCMHGCVQLYLISDHPVAFAVCNCGYTDLLDRHLIANTPEKTDVCSRVCFLRLTIVRPCLQQTNRTQTRYRQIEPKQGSPCLSSVCLFKARSHVEDHRFIYYICIYTRLSF